MNTLPRISPAERADLIRRAQYLRKNAPSGLLAHVADVALKRLAGIEPKTPDALAAEMVERHLPATAGTPGPLSRLNAKNSPQ